MYPLEHFELHVKPITFEKKFKIRLNAHQAEAKRNKLKLLNYKQIY